MRPDKKPHLIYLAGPGGQLGGGIFRIVDNVVRANPFPTIELRRLNTRGDGAAWRSFVSLAGALSQLLIGRFSGRLVGVHVNMAERLSVLRKACVVFVSRALGLPVVLHLHACGWPQFYLPLARPIQYLVRWVFLSANQVVVLGERSKVFLIDVMELPPQRINVLTNGVPSPSGTRRRFDPDKPFEILFVGEVSERKGVSDLLNALASSEMMARREHWRARFAGGGNVEQFSETANELGLAKQVEFLGWMERDRLAEFLADSDVLVLPSNAEGLPLAILEAFANSVAVVCTPVGEIPDLIKDGDHALFVNVGDVKELAVRLCDLMNQPLLRERLESRGFSLYRDHFTFSGFLRGLGSVYEQAFALSSSRINAMRIHDGK